MTDPVAILTAAPRPPSPRKGRVFVSPRLLDLLRQVAEFLDSRGYAPTLGELAALRGKSRVTVHEALQRLSRAGLLSHARYQGRSYRLTDAGRAALGGKQCPHCGGAL